MLKRFTWILPLVCGVSLLLCGAQAAGAEEQAQAAAVRERWDAAFADTSWAGAEMIASALRYTDGEIDAVLAAARAEDATVLCVFVKSGDEWLTAASDSLFPPETDANDLSVRFLSSVERDPGYAGFTVSALSQEGGSPTVTFERNGQDVWQAVRLTFWETETERWRAEFADGVMQLYAGSYIGEEGYLYAAVDSAQTAWVSFDFQAMKNVMYQLYDDFMAGEPPLIPDDGSAYALPQPCGAQLKEGTYAVYSGPGTQYWREADGKAAVSANDWVQVFGADGGWVLIQYRIDGPLLRFGYIQSSALQDPDAVPALTFEAVALTDTGNEFVTSNPLGLGNRIYLNTSGLTMTRLGTLGNYWMYVELTLPNGQPARMFTETQATHG